MFRTTLTRSLLGPLARVRRVLAPSLLALLITALLGAGSPAPTLAYGNNANWQIGISGTGVGPGTGMGMGFWGWFTFGGGVTSGNIGDGQFAQYVHNPAGGGFTCHVSLNITSWTVRLSPTTGGNTFFISGTASASPASVATPCLTFFPGGTVTGTNTTYSNVDTLVPAAPGHYNLGGSPFPIPVFIGEFQIQVSQVG